MSVFQPYQDFLNSKRFEDAPSGFAPGVMTPGLFPHQRKIVEWACRRGRAAVFADTGLGKTMMELEFSRQVCLETGGGVLILAPLCVAEQTSAQAKAFGVKADVTRDMPGDVSGRIIISNYEMMGRFDISRFAGVVLDESSILKHHTAKTRTRIIQAAAETPYRLSCTATPAPNDWVELGNQSEFLGVMPQHEMLPTFFTHDGGDTSKWRLKGHGAGRFWEWVASWAVILRMPSDIGCPDDGYDLPPLRYVEHVVESPAAPGKLFPDMATGIQGRNRARKESLQARVEACARVARESTGPFLIWCHLNAESDALEKAIPGAVQVRGSDRPEKKSAALLGFASGKARVLITKPSIAGFGLNWQHCRQMAFVGLSDSYEQFYQAVRRCWRFGQQHPVTAHLFVSEAEGPVLENIQEKERQAQTMSAAVIDQIKRKSAWR